MQIYAYPATPIIKFSKKGSTHTQNLFSPSGVTHSFSPAKSGQKVGVPHHTTDNLTHPTSKPKAVTAFGSKPKSQTHKIPHYAQTVSPAKDSDSDAVDITTPVEKKPHHTKKNSAKHYPPPPLYRATSEDQKLIDNSHGVLTPKSHGKLVYKLHDKTPTTRHVLAQVPARYFEHAQRLQTALHATELDSFFQHSTYNYKQNLVPFINSSIIKDYYSQVVDRYYNGSKTPSPTAALTVLYEAAIKAQIHDYDHATKVNYLLSRIRNVIHYLEPLKSTGIMNTQAAELSEIADRFISFFTKIGLACIDALNAYRASMPHQTISGSEEHHLHNFFGLKSIDLNRGYVLDFFDADQAEKLSPSLWMTPHKKQLKADFRSIQKDPNIQTVAKKLSYDIDDFPALGTPSKSAATSPVKGKQKAIIHDEDGNTQNPNEISFVDADQSAINEFLNGK